MKLERIAYTAVAALLMAACSGGDEPTNAAGVNAAQTTTTLLVEEPSNEGRDLVEQAATSTVPATPAPTSTEAVPESLAFTSSRDLGRLFEIDGVTVGLTSPGQGDQASSLADGTLVRAAQVSSVSGELWVRLIDEAQVAVGWVPAGDLRSTVRTLTSFEADHVGQYWSVRGAVPGDEVSIRSQPGSGSEVGELAELEIEMLGGNVTLTADGEKWIDIVDPQSGAAIGWVPSSQLLPLTQNQVRSLDNAEVPRRADAEISYGATLPLGQVVATGCNATQISFSNSNAARGLALLLGLDVPVGRQLSSGTSWSSRGGTVLFVDPGDTVILSFLTDSARTWYFTALDADGQAANDGQTNSVGDIVASNVQRFDLDRGSCAFESVLDIEEEFGDLIDSGNDADFEGLTSEERAAKLLELAAERELEENGGVASETAVGEELLPTDDPETASDSPETEDVSQTE